VTAPHPLGHLVGKPLPGGHYALAGYENWLSHDALYSAPEETPHPVMAFVAAQRGLGVSVPELFALFGTEMSDGPMLLESELEFPGEAGGGATFRADAEYAIDGTVTSVVRKTGRTLGTFDVLTARFEVSTADHGEVVARVTNTYALPRAAQEAAT
jgi:hypothetical protein